VSLELPTFTRSQTINAPVERVFATVSNLETFAEWNPTIKAARKLGDGAIGEGTEFEFRIRGVGRTVQRLERFEQDRQVRLVPQNGPVAGGHLFVMSSEAGSTRIDHELEMEPKGFFKLFGPMITKMGEKNLRDTADSLKRYLETR
jgi:carbon monoxide dehydrogenase subunit G